MFVFMIASKELSVIRRHSQDCYDGTLVIVLRNLCKGDIGRLRKEGREKGNVL